MLPVALQRTGEQFSQQRLLQQLRGNEVAVQRLYEQLSTGRRLLRPSDEPLSAAQANGLQRAIEYVDQLERNSQSADGFFLEADSAAAELADVLSSARGIAVEGAGNTLDPQSRQALASELEDHLGRLLAASGRQFRNQYLFGGASGEPPLRQIGGQVAFQAAWSVRQVPLDNGLSTPIGTNLSTALGVGAVAIVGADLDPQVSPDSTLRELLRGAGPLPGTIEFIGDGPPAVTVDLGRARTIRDVLSAVSRVEISGRTLKGEITGHQLTIGFADGAPGTLAIRDVAGQWAESLGIQRAAGASGPIQSIDLDPALSLTTPVDRLRQGSGLDLSAGLLIQQGEQVYTVATAHLRTVSDLLIAINRSGANVWAELSGDGRSVQIRNLLSGVDLSIGENGGQVATALGLRTATVDTPLADLQQGRGIQRRTGPELAITRPDGMRFEIELTDGFRTVGDVINAIHVHPSNQGPGAITAKLASIGNGIELAAIGGAGPLRVEQLNGSDVGVALGLILPGRAEASVESQPPTATVLRGKDFAPRGPTDAVDALLRLRTAIADGDQAEIERISARLDGDLDPVNFARGQIGTGAQAAERSQQFAADRRVELRQQLSTEIDADLAETTSQLQLRQTAMEASLRLLGQLSQLSLLNFL
jgi:flagellar hook-associated protein 3 FlgL